MTATLQDRQDSAGGIRAVNETNAVVIGESAEAKLGFEAHNRFVDRVEKRDGRWRIAERTSVYDFAHFTFPAGWVETPSLGDHPREYAAMAALLESGGFPVRGTFATRGSAAERKIKVSATTWMEMN